MAAVRNFFPMGAGEKGALAFLVLASAASFLPITREVQVAGMALFGWLMAGLMVLSPILTLWVFRRGRPRR